jgi:hypothetical protein
MRQVIAGLRRPALETAGPKPASQDMVLNVSKVASNSFAGAPGIGQKRVPRVAAASGLSMANRQPA